MSIRHRISKFDATARSGVCSVCGPTDIYVGPRYKGRSYWRCATARLKDETSRYWTNETYRDGQRNARFLREFGITLKEYNDMFEAQAGLCARCGNPPASMRLAVDHDHETGRVRGLLCGSCNTYIGRLEANLSTLEADLAYIGARLLSLV